MDFNWEELTPDEARERIKEEANAIAERYRFNRRTESTIEEFQKELEVMFNDVVAHGGEQWECVSAWYNKEDGTIWVILDRTREQ